MGGGGGGAPRNIFFCTYSLTSNDSVEGWGPLDPALGGQVVLGLLGGALQLPGGSKQNNFEFYTISDNRSMKKKKSIVLKKTLISLYVYIGHLFNSPSLSFFYAELKSEY